jgi:MFS family permease
MVNLFANSAYSSIAPFYPVEACKKGVHVGALGFIFAGYSLSMFVFSPLFSKMLTKHGRKNVLLLGCLCESMAIISMGLLDYVEDPVVYIALSFLCRVIEGFGNGCLSSSTNSIICFYFEDNMSNLIGLTQTFTGLGMLSGPLFGSFLYEHGGFKTPFLVTGAMLFILVIPISVCF